MGQMKRKRYLSGLLAGFILVMSIVSAVSPIASYAAAFSGQNIWSGGSEQLFGSNRSYLYRWSDGFQNTFCIEPGMHMGKDVSAYAGRYYIEDDDIPYINSQEDFKRLALICDWYDRIAGSKAASNASYAAAQIAIWAVIAGEWEKGGEMAARVDPHITGDVNQKFNEVRYYVEAVVYGSNGLPEWCSTSDRLANPQIMELSEGQYQLRLDLTGYPELAGVVWQLPPGYHQFISETSLVFTYNGTGVPSGLLQGQAPASMNGIFKNSEWIAIFTPNHLERDQAMISAGIDRLPNRLYINIGGAKPTTPTGESPVVEIFRHKETFESNYLIDLQKLCAETGLELEGSVFDVLESFDGNQLGNGKNGSVAEGKMSLAPVTWTGWRVCGQIMTNVDGYAKHSDRKFYSYNKTYCGGHPEPEYLEVPEYESDEETGEDNQDQIDAVEAENARLLAEWEALVELCEDETDFHAIEEGEAEEQMIADRDETYDTFTNLIYQYTVREKTARPGYLIHGGHNDDQSIEVIATNASEAGANAVVIPTVRAMLARTAPGALINYGRALVGSEEPWEPEILRSEIPEPESQEGELEKRRTITMVEGALATNSQAEVATPSELKKGTPSKAQRRANRTKKSGKIQTLSKLLRATSSNARTADHDVQTYHNIDLDNFEEWQAWMEQQMEQGGFWYQYRREPIFPVMAMKAPQRMTATASEAIEADLPGLLARITNFFADDEDEEETPVAVFVSLPEPELDHVSHVTAGPAGNFSYHFTVENHRTEGELHFNKRDLELYREDADESYGQAQGDATLEGAVYGLFAATDLIHPDGKTGVVYAADDLTAIATTDANGDFSFLAFTEESDTSLAAPNRAGTWIGHPLLLGSYYVKELSRSEGYELSVTGIELTESNRLGGAEGSYLPAGEVSASGLSHRIDEQDGSWNDTTVSYYRTEQGFDVVISGYPEDTQLYEVTVTETSVTDQAVIDSQLVPKTDGSGNPVYQTAVGGELKLDASGNPVPLGGEDLASPVAETWYTYYRVGQYPSGTATPQIDPVKWADPLLVDESYLQEEVNDMLAQLGYTVLDTTDGEGAPWQTLTLSGTTNEQIGTELLDWFTTNRFYNCAAIESITFDGTAYQARVFYDYEGQAGSSIYDALSGQLYIKKTVTVSGGAASSHAWLEYPAGSFALNSFYATVAPKKQWEGTIPFGDDMDAFLVEKYQPLYDRYSAGEVLLDLMGNPISEMEWQFTYGPVTEVIQEETLTPVTAVYDAVLGTYTIHVDNTVDWSSVTDRQQITYRVKTPQTSISVGGKIMDYSDYLVQIKGAGVSVLAAREPLAEGSYVRFADLVYPGQVQPYQDAGTRTVPIPVLERVIKQSIKVTKDISQESYTKNNTYKIHRDPFTVLFGGYVGSGKKYIADFHFKTYLVSDLVEAGLLSTNADGSYDYQALFEDEDRRSEFDVYAVEWDKPEKDLDGDLTTLHASEGSGSEPYYGRSIMLPYGTYVVVEQIPRNLINKHYDLAAPQEVTLPYVPQIDADGTVHEDLPSSDYRYFSSYTPEELTEKFLIRFNEETHVIQAHNNDGDFAVYKYGLAPQLLPDPYENTTIGSRYHYGQSEQAGMVDEVYYDLVYDAAGNVLDYGATLDGVDTMTGISTAVNGKYAAALVPWSVLDPRQGEVINDHGDIGNRSPGLEGGSFNFVAFAKRHFENTFYSSKLRIEKLDARTGENILHDGAIFKIYAASRDVSGQGASSVTGSGQVIWETITVTGTRAELEARGDVDGITWDATAQVYTGTVTQPVYDEAEQIFMKNELGQEVGIFKALSTEHTVIKADGTVSKEKVGYLETYQPLGAGVYVVVEVQSPVGYQKSKPIAVEIYKDEVNYYTEGDPSQQTLSDRYQYVIPLTNGSETEYQDVSKVVVTDAPSRMYLHKVEDGDQAVGDVNGLDPITNVNDRGDQLTYVVRGRREYLEARGDAADITWDAVNREYWGTVTKSFDEWSENLIAGTEAELLAMSNVKPLYDVTTGYFSGYGIRFDRAVREATMSLYEGLQITRTGLHSYAGVNTVWEDGAVTSIIASHTGSHLEIRQVGQDSTPPYLPIRDTVEVANEPIAVYFYDLTEIAIEADATGEFWALDDRGNRICYVDALTGMAYTKDDYGNLIVYHAVDGEKVLAQSIEVHNDGAEDYLYLNVVTAEDEVGLPLYYESGELTYRPERWQTDGTPHLIERLAFGAYIVEEGGVPYDQGYIKVPDMGLILRPSSEEQHFFYQNVFTKLNLAKIDVSTKAEIQDAGMTLYTAIRIPDESERGYHLEKDQIYAEWISGYEYDDNGNLMLDGSGNPIPTSAPHWLDHIPVGDYILEETLVPYDQGYVQSAPVEVEVTNTGNVQTGVMADDYTALELKKLDTKTQAVLDNDHRARLGLYPAVLDGEGKPVVQTIGETEVPVYEAADQLITWWTDEGADVAATGRWETDEYGETKWVYDYVCHEITTTKKGRYYITENGTTRFEYLPVGFYVWVEEETPDGYATADPVLIEIKDEGQLETIHYYEMPDVPLTVDLWKRNQSLGKVVRDAFVEVYRVDQNGIKEEPAVYSFYTGADGVFTLADQEAGTIPEGFAVGDLKPHRIEYILLGDYMMEEKITPYGHLKAEAVYFTVVDTPKIQEVEMIDEIPTGILTIIKHDQDDPDWLLAQATFEYRNQTLGTVIGQLTTDETGWATASNAVPIGYLNEEGYFEPYTYEVEEIDAPDSHMINRIPFEFQYQYENEYIPVLEMTYDAENMINQVKVSKLELTSQEELPGAEMMVTGKYTRQIVDHWISTGQPHYIYGLMPGEYVLYEIMVPSAGYAKAEPMDFTITENMEVIPHMIMNDDHTKVQIDKVDARTGQRLPDAHMQLETLDGAIIKQWLTTDNEYLIYGLAPGDYCLKEIQAPSGYQLGKPITITIEDTFNKQVFTYRNSRLSSTGKNLPPKPEVPPIEKKETIGEITADYHSDLGGWWQKWLEELPRLGDQGKTWGVGIIIALLFFYTVTLISKNRKQRWRFWILLLLTTFFLKQGIRETAAAAPSQTDETVVVKWLDNTKLFYVPPLLYEDQQGKKYWLRSYTIDSLLPSNERIWIEEEVIFEQVEERMLLPESKVIRFHNQKDQTIERDFAIDTIFTIKQYWSADFILPLIFHTYSAERYQLSGELIRVEKDHLQLAGYEQQLLQMAGLRPDRYQITEFAWEGDEYVDEQGDLCRKALATGSRLIEDLAVIYGGYYQETENARLQVSATYESLTSKRRKEGSVSKSMVIEEKSKKLAAPGQLVSNPPASGILQKVIRISIALGTLLTLLALFVALKMELGKRRN